ncbi:ABC transporter family substrate-binding protein [Salinactinospora qingdaonensis]|uniref:ABC transporter family substrate-binding protein n=1 Tax=Salinactinospora qingdaonensis TaxID=702744 RepID=A0ABP7F113_9ACTN
MSTARAASLVTPTLTLALLLTACSLTGGHPAGHPAGDPPDLADIPAIDINANDRSHTRQGGTLNWAIAHWGGQFQAHHTQGNLAGQAHILGALLPRAHTFDAQGTPAPNTAYVERTTLSHDGTRLTYHLNPAATWSTGQPITWNDYRATAELLSTPTPGDFATGGARQGYDRIDRILPGHDDYEFTLVFSEPYSEWPRLFEFVYPARYMSDADAFNHGYRDRIPVTAGPFKVDHIDPAAKTLTLVRDNTWWGTPAKLDRIVFHTMDRAAMPGAFLNGEIDTFYLGHNASAYERVHGHEGTHVTRAIDNGYRMIQLNAASPALADIDVRRAITYGIDRSVLADISLRPIDWPGDPTVNRLIRSSQPHFHDNSGDYGHQDLDKARRLLRRAGWRATKGTDYRHNVHGDELSLRYLIPAGPAITEHEATAVQHMLAEIGVKIEIETVPLDAYLNDHLQRGDFALTSLSLTGTTPYAGSYHTVYGGPFGHDDSGAPHWADNHAHLSSAQINDTFRRMAAETTPKLYYDLANTIDRALWDQATSIPFLQRPGTWAVRDDLANFGAFGLASIDYADIAYLH